MAGLQAAQVPIRTLETNKCPHHREKEVVFMCEDCDGELCCTTCAITFHNKHELKEIKDILQQAKGKIRDGINKTESTYLPELDKELHKLDGELSRNEKHFMNIITKFQNQNDDLKMELDNITNALVTMCQETKSRNSDILKDHEKHLQLKVEEANGRLNQLKNILETGTDAQIYLASSDIQYDSNIPCIPTLQKLDPKTTLLEELNKNVGHFCTDDHQASELSSVISCQLSANAVSEINEIHSNADTDKSSKTIATQSTTKKDNFSKPSKKKDELLKSMISFTHKNHIETIRPTFDNQVFVHKGSKLQVLNHTGKIQKTIKMEVCISDFCVSPFNGDIWFCTLMDSNVRKITGDRTSTVMFNTNSEPLSICISIDGNILLGMERQIVKYTQSGQILCSSSADITWLMMKQGLAVRYPRRISQCLVTRNVAVLDLDYKDYGGDGKTHVSVLSESLEVLCRYYGRGVESFCPCDVCYSEAGDIYIADNDNGAIEKLNGKGQFIHSVHSPRNKHANSLCVHSNGDIWAVFGYEVTIIQQL